MDYNALLYDPIYLIQGVDADLTPAEGEPIGIRLLDKTIGFELESSGPSKRTIRPAAIIRVKELEGKGLRASQLVRGTVIFNQQTWKILNTMPRPSPRGEYDGELLLILSSLGRIEESESESESESGSES